MRNFVLCLLFVALVAIVRDSFALNCAPYLTTTKTACLAKQAVCASQGIILKWATQGCHLPSGHLAGDGGCQCNEYCGYGCASSCVRDSQCYWNKPEGKCYNKKTHQPGFPIPVCPATTTPTVSPTKSPTPPPTFKPTLSPTHMPSTSPTRLPTFDIQ